MADPGAGKERLAATVHDALAHDSAFKHVSGRALYIDDLPVPGDCLHVAPGRAGHARARILSMDLSAVRTAPGVALVLTADDIPGLNDVSPIGAGDDLVLADGMVSFYGQALFAVAAESYSAARHAATLANVDYEVLEPILDIAGAREAHSQVSDPYEMSRGDVAGALEASPHRLNGSLAIGGQEQFYLEGQVSLAIPMEDGDVFVHCSTQHPSEVQHNVANVLGLSDNAVTVEVRRMGGAFGGKESQAAQWAALAALVAVKTGRAAKCRLDRDDDMVMTGKRHDFVASYDVGFDADGRIRAAEVSLDTRCGISKDLSDAIADRAMFHVANGYYIDALKVVCARLKTNTVSNTAFRGFGGPQGMMAGEWMIEEVARTLGKDPLDVRKANFFGPGRDTTHYGMQVQDFVLDKIVDELETSADYRRRREEILGYNAAAPLLRRGLALTPVQFGISFTTSHLNQAGALLHIYKDGSVHLNHGGTEMGQGLYIKVAQVVAAELQVEVERIKITATTTAKVPNTSATAASSGSDMNGMAAQAAARMLKQRLTAFASQAYGVMEESIAFRAGRVLIGNQEVSFEELVMQAYLARVQLSATGFYRTPKIKFDRDTGKGRPFYYFAYGAAVSEVAIDTLTGESRLLRCDILHDVGRSLNPAMDKGQIEGGFIQGMGWLTAEELCWDAAGRLTTHAPSTYKIPTCGDRPDDLRIELWPPGENVEPTIHRSKAVGEPPLMLAMSVFHAIADAISSLSDYRRSARLDAPATPERILAAVEEMQAAAGP